jgi:hypothetical protein
MDMVLPIEAYTITFDASGGGFEDGGTTITMTAPENETLMPPSASHSEYAFTEWYSTDGKSFTAETPITGDATVYARWLVSIVITSLPTKTAYFVGEVLDLSGLVITEIYSNNTTKTETVSMDNVSGYNTDTTGQQVLTVTVNSKTATFTVTVNAITLVSIAITSPPTKTTYLTGESLNLSGLEVTGTYTNNTTKMESVSVDNISRYDTNSAGQQTLTVTVGDKTASFSIIIETPDDTEHSTLSVKDAILNDVNVLPSSTSAGYISMGYDKDLDCVVLTYKVGVIENMFLQYLSTVVVAAPGRKFTYTEIVGSSVTQQIENMSMVIASISGNIYFAGAKASAYTEAQFLGFGNGATAGTKASASAGNIGFDLTSVTRTTYTETYTNWLQVSNSLEQDMSVYEQGKKYAIAAFADVGVYQVLKYNPKTHNATAIPGKSLYFNVESIPAWDVYEYSKNEEIDIPNKLSPFQQIEITVSESDLYSDLKKSEQFKRTNDLNNIGSSSRDEVFNPSLLTAVLECFDYDKVRIDVSFAYKAESILGGGLRLQIANSNKSAELSRKEFSRGISWGDTSCSVTVDISSLNSPTCQFMLLWSKTRTCEYSVGTRTISITAVK